MDFSHVTKVVGLQPTRKSYILPGVSTMRTILGTIEKDKQTVVNLPTDLSIWLALFFCYGEHFISKYERYTLDPDLIVGFQEGASPPPLQKDNKERVINAIDVRCTCHLLLIAMLKQFPTKEEERTRQIQQYIIKRKKAVYAVVGSDVGNFVLQSKFLETYSSVMTILPKLKKILFYFAYENQNYFPELKLSTVLLANNGMTTIQAMVEFIDAEQLTYAHTNMDVLRDVGKFLPLVDKIKDELGPMWPYYRILKSKDATLNAFRFQYLASCAIAWKKKFGDATFKFVQLREFPGVYQTHLRAATTIDPRDLRTEEWKESKRVAALEAAAKKNEATPTSDISVEELQKRLKICNLCL